MASVADIVNQAKLPERIVHVCLRGDLLADLQAAEEQAKDQHVNDDRLGPDPDAVSPEVETLRAEIKASVVPFRLRGINKPTMDRLIVENKPREGDDTDKAVGYNFQAVRDLILRESLVDPYAADDDEWKQLEEALPYSQWEELTSAAYQLAASKVDAPFLRAG